MTIQKSAFQAFDQAALNGDALNIVFMGGSLTWGANSTDPQLYSYRAHLMRCFQERYPNAPLKYWDAAIGGQGSQLGIFRLDRDVLSRQPNLLFLEYAVNDGPSDMDEERLASFEAIVRRVIREGGCPIVISILAVKEDMVEPSPNRPRHAAHRAIATAYGCGLALTAPWIRDQLRLGRVRIEDLWANPNWPNPTDVTHPGNLGYELYAEAIWQAFSEAVQNKITCMTPDKMLHPATYLKTTRSSLAKLRLPDGWKKGQPNRISAAYDFLMSRWLDDLVIAHRADSQATPSPFTIRFRGATALLFGESTPSSGRYRVQIDGKPSQIKGPKEEAEPGIFRAATGLPGNGPLVQVLAEGLDSQQEHTLTIQPLLDPGQELRIESLCIAGDPARVIG